MARKRTRTAAKKTAASNTEKNTSGNASAVIDVDNDSSSTSEIPATPPAKLPKRKSNRNLPNTSCDETANSPLPISSQASTSKDTPENRVDDSFQINANKQTNRPSTSEDTPGKIVDDSFEININKPKSKSSAPKQAEGSPLGKKANSSQPTASGRTTEDVNGEMHGQNSTQMTSNSSGSAHRASESEIPDSEAGPSGIDQSQDIRPPCSIRPKVTAADLGFAEDEDGVIRIDDIVIPPAPAPAMSNDVPDSRLIITDLIIQNFKSYAGTQVISNFEKNFTAVVGPNGSGKSNVIDSLLFVFGYKAKKIRSKKASELIHRSDRYPDLTFCSVTVNFATIKDGEGSKYEILKDTRFTLKRTAHSDDSSYYEMCNKRVKYRDVAKTLKAYGIDLEHSRFLILQGEIEAISLMHAKAEKETDTGMLEYIEDVIGSNRFIEPIKSIEERALKLNEEVKEKLTHLKLVEKEKDDLEGPKDQAIEYLKLENKLYTAENSLYHLQRYGAEKELEETVARKEKYSEKMNALKEKLDTLRSSKKSLEAEMQKLTSEYESFMKKCDENKEEFAALEREDAANMMNIKHIKEKNKSLEKSLETAKTELGKLKKQIETYESETSELQVKKQKLAEEKGVEEKKMTEVMGSLKTETNLLQEKKDKFESELIKLKDNMYKKKSEMDLAQSEHNLCLSGEKKEKEKLSALIANLENSTKSAENEEKMLSEEETQIQNIEDELVQLKDQLTELAEKEAVLTEKVKSDNSRLDEAKSTINASQHRGKIMSAFAKEKARGRFTGVYGRLGDLGAINEKYDVAISTACAQLDQIVTDTMETAQECVNFLKQHNLGYCTFIPLDKMKVWEQQANSKINTPENVPRLFDLVQVMDKNLLPAFYYALRDCLVASNLDQATRIGMRGKVRYRVVTLTGQLVDLSGTMSGGGNSVLRGRMGSKVVQSNLTIQDIERMDDELNETKRKLLEVKRTRQKNEEQISLKTSTLSSLHHSIKKRKLHYNAHKESVKILAAQIADQEVKVKDTTVDRNKVKHIEKKIQESKKEYDNSVQEASVVEEKVSTLQEEILKISKGKFSKVKKNVDQLGKKLGEVTQSLTKSSVNMKTAIRNIKKNEDKISNHEKEMESNKEKLQHLKKQQDALTDKGQKATELISENEAKAQNFKEKRTSVKKELEVISEKEHKLKSEEIEFKNHMKTFEAKESEKRAFIRHINSKMSKLKLNEVEDDPTELPIISADEISKLSADHLASDIEITKAKLADLKPDFSAISEFKKKEKLCDEKQKAVDETTSLRNLQNKRCDELRSRRVKEFMAAFCTISKKLKEIYQMITLGGDAELELVDSFNPFSKGIDFVVRPPKKSWKFMRNLSGGEKTLSSLALVFALHYYRPTPFYVMDEIDAALDVRNVAIVGYFLKVETKNTQFIIISLRNVMNELSDQLLGIFKVKDCTRILMLRDTSQWSQPEEDQELPPRPA